MNVNSQTTKQETTEDFACYESVVYNMKNSTIDSVERGISTIPYNKCGMSGINAVSKCQNESIVYGIQQITCCSIDNLSNNLIAQPVNCFICNDQSSSPSSSCVHPEVAHCGNSIACKRTQPTERCYSTVISSATGEKLHAQRGITTDFTTDCSNRSENITGGLTVTQRCCKDEFCNG
ncbi:unnamed protein product [Rotaria sordida]|uniref:Uncharacterized protein n=1 Tax=Rotaria sordida TaxID=392033 RepID=A0A815BFU7_9BILA|nr:unnamed protein product [Rotaria sordida]